MRVARALRWWVFGVREGSGAESGCVEFAARWIGCLGIVGLVCPDCGSFGRLCERSVRGSGWEGGKGV